MNGDTVVLDKEILENLRAAVGDRVAHIVRVYLDEVPRNIDTMRNAIAKQDWESVRITVHSLKSSSANVGAMRVSQLAAQMERNLQQKDVANVTTDLNNLQLAFDQVRPMFSEYL